MTIEGTRRLQESTVPLYNTLVLVKALICMYILYVPVPVSNYCLNVVHLKCVLLILLLQVLFKTRIYHCNINSQVGAFVVCVWELFVSVCVCVWIVCECVCIVWMWVCVYCVYCMWCRGRCVWTFYKTSGLQHWTLAKSSSLSAVCSNPVTPVSSYVRTCA